MKKRTASLFLSGFFGIGIALAAPPLQEPANASPQTDVQATRHHKPDSNRQVQMLKKHLNLTDSQQSQILQILTDRDQQLAAIDNDGSLSQEDRRSKVMSLRQDTNAKVRATLDDNQKQSYDQLIEQMRDRARQHRRNQQDATQNPGASS